ncbi:GvpL/GvpF family gas vesicle protein [Nocardia sp. NPDC057353]|uniref:GvpL/GvpF family gas vesicle protein n=1 Tax=Nocardia sp. NPDC057353 TaxID=3346104 RepID=UPI003627730C
MSTALLVYGIVPAELEPRLDGIGDPPAPVRTVRHGAVAALVSEVDDRPLGNPDDLRAYVRVVDGAAADGPVIPVRFGAALRGREVVERTLLAPHAERLRATLDELTGHAEYLLHGRYRADGVRAEIVADEPVVREAADGEPSPGAPGATLAALAAMRRADADTALAALRPLAEQFVARKPTEESDAVDIAVLLARDRHDALIEAARELAGEWADRVELTLAGPLAPWDFVTVDAGTTG